MKNELRDVLIAQLEKVNKVNAELKLRLSDVIKSLPDSEIVNIKEVKNNPNNPRLIKDDKFKKLVQSIKDFLEMLS